MAAALQRLGGAKRLGVIMNPSRKATSSWQATFNLLLGRPFVCQFRVPPGIFKYPQIRGNAAASSMMPRACGKFRRDAKPLTCQRDLSYVVFTIYR